MLLQLHEWGHTKYMLSGVYGCYTAHHEGQLLFPLCYKGVQVEQRFGIKLMKCSVFVHPAQGCSSEVLKASVPSKYSLPLGEKKKVNPKLPGRKYSSYFLQQAQSREPEISKSFISRNQSTAEFRTGNTHADLCIAPTNPTSLSRPWDQCFCLIIT